MGELSISTPTLRRMHEDWESRRQGRLLPARRSFDIMDFKYIVGSLNLVDVERNPMRFRYRVHGTNCVNILGYDMTGKYVDDYPDPAYRRRVGENFRGVVETRAPRCDIGRRAIVDGRIIRFEALILPLADDGETVDKLMIALSLA